MLVGVAFFMPTRISFSIWFFMIAYAGYFVFCSAYTPPFYSSTIVDHRLGAMLTIGSVIIWLGRKHWAIVFSTLWRSGLTEVERGYRSNALIFIAGCLGVMGWMLWIGVQPL